MFRYLFLFNHLVLAVVLVFPFLFFFSFFFACRPVDISDLTGDASGGDEDDMDLSKGEWISIGDEDVSGANIPPFLKKLIKDKARKEGRVALRAGGVGGGSRVLHALHALAVGPLTVRFWFPEGRDCRRWPLRGGSK